MTSTNKDNTDGNQHKTTPPSSRKKISIILISTLLILGSIFLIAHTLKSNKFSCEQEYKYLNPDLNCTHDNTEKMTVLQDKLKTYTEAERKADRISIFFRDLKTRRWLGVNENDSFSPGSLLKVPFAVTYLKYSEINPDILNQKIPYTSQPESFDWDSIQVIKPEQKLKQGESYPISELIERMIKYSDNQSMYLLSQTIDESFVKKVFVDLGAYFPTSIGIEQDYLSVKTYASILRSLYLASYLNRETSEKLLEIMVSSTFKDGLVAGVSKDTVVAHKFGERQTLDQDGNRIDQLHDCGIIYHKENPYILCIMTQGKKPNDLIDIIKTISKIVFEFQS